MLLGDKGFRRLAGCLHPVVAEGNAKNDGGLRVTTRKDAELQGRQW
jgi:hypothetical protein